VQDVQGKRDCGVSKVLDPCKEGVHQSHEYTLSTLVMSTTHSLHDTCNLIVHRAGVACKLPPYLRKTHRRVMTGQVASGMSVLSVAFQVLNPIQCNPSARRSVQLDEIPLRGNSEKLPRRGGIDKLEWSTVRISKPTLSWQCWNPAAGQSTRQLSL